MVRNVVVPTLTVYRPEAANATGTGVIIAPGGAFRFLSIDSEGHEVARWLVKRGIAAFVLKYRVIETPENDAEMWTELRQLLGGSLRNFDEDARLGIADGLQAMKLVRERAHEWGLSSECIGFMGFSAGAMITSHVALRAPEGESARLSRRRSTVRRSARCPRFRATRLRCSWPMQATTHWSARVCSPSIKR
jgi:dienelactone hydrolase